LLYLKKPQFRRKLGLRFFYSQYHELLKLIKEKY